MEFGTIFFIWFILVFFFDVDGFSAIFWMVLVSLIFYGGCSVKINTDIKTPPAQEIIEPQKPRIKSTPVTNFGNVKQEYIDNTMRSSDVVEVVNINGEVLACTKLNECFNPTIKKHLDNVLYACNSTKCYTIKESL
jgi:PBP1b-binding outer membrane lipoprotein LpoB